MKRSIDSIELMASCIGHVLPRLIEHLAVHKLPPHALGTRTVIDILLEARCPIFAEGLGGRTVCSEDLCPLVPHVYLQLYARQCGDCVLFASQSPRRWQRLVDPVPDARDEVSSRNTALH